MNQKYVDDANRELSKFHRSIETLVLLAWSITVLAMCLSLAIRRHHEIERKAAERHIERTQ